jgi:hypothetical protein
VGLSGTLLVFALMNKFGLYLPYFGCNNYLFILCTCYFNELILFLSKLFNNSIWDNTFLVKIFNNSNIHKTFLFIQRIFKFILTMLFSGRFNGFGFNPNEIKMNVVENSSNSIGNNNGKGNENNDVNNNKDSDVSNDKRAKLTGVARIQTTYGENSIEMGRKLNMTYIGDSTTPMKGLIHSNDEMALRGEEYKDSIS